MTFTSQPAPLKPLSSADIMTGPRAPRRGKAHPTFQGLDYTPSAQERHHQQLRSAAEKLVAQTFFGTLLKQMHESPFRSKIFDGGRGGQAFSSLYNQVLSERMSHSGTAGKLVDSIVRRNERAAAYQKQSNPLNAATKAGSRGKKTASPPAATPNPYQNVKIHVAPQLRA
jgi:Rod binding domain-containing protein